MPFSDGRPVRVADLNVDVDDSSVQERLDGPCAEQTASTGGSTRGITGAADGKSNLQKSEQFVRRHDPDADYYHTNDGERSKTPGRGLVLLEGRNRYPDERIVFGLKGAEPAPTVASATLDTPERGSAAKPAHNPAHTPPS